MSRNPNPTPAPGIPPPRVPPGSVVAPGSAVPPGSAAPARPAVGATPRPAAMPRQPTAAPVPGAGAAPRQAPATAAAPGAAPAKLAASPVKPPAATPAKPAAAAPRTAAPAEKLAAPPAKPAAPAAIDVVARGSNDYRVRRYLMVALLIGMGAWFAYDGFRGWPEENKKIIALTDLIEKYNREGNIDKQKELDRDPLAHKPKHSDKDLFFQKLLAITLPLLGGITLAWALYNSRGEYRLSGKVLSVPGHPPVPLGSITTIDRKEWDRKGIAYIEYKTGEGGTAAFDLDDFIYQRDETDKIFEMIEAYVASGKREGAAGESA